MQYIDETKILKLTRHNLDYIGEVFKYEGRILRKIKEERREYVLDLFNKGIIAELVEFGGVIPTWIVNDLKFKSEEEALIIEHAAIFPLSYHQEWTFGMFDDARKMVIRVNSILLKYEYELYDAHYGNVGFCGCYPVYMDLGSIVPQKNCLFKSYELFLRFWVYPFKLLKSKRMDKEIVHCLIKYNDEGISLNQYLRSKYLFSGLLLKFINIKKRVCENIWFETSSKKWIKGAVHIFKRIFFVKANNIHKKKQELYSKYLSLSFGKDIIKGDWSDYHEENVNGKNIISNERFDYYLELVDKLKNEDKIDTSFEIAGNAGIFSQLLIEKGYVNNAIVSDYDMGAIEAGYVRCKHNEIISNKISFAVINIMNLMQNTRELIEMRYQSDIVFALAVSHHLILTQKVKLSVIVDILKKYTKKFVVVEFMPLGIWESDNNCQPVPEWYTLDWFIKGLSEEFIIIEVRQLRRNRIAVVGKKK